MLTKFIFSAGEVSFNRAERPGKERGDFAVREALLEAEVNRELFVGGECAQRGAEIVTEVGEVNGSASRLGQGVGGKFGVLALAAARVAPVIVRDAQQPGRERSGAPETGERAVSLNESFLREIVGQRSVAPGEVPEELADGGLMTPDEFAEGGAIVGGQRSRDQLEVGRHERGAGGVLSEGGWPPTMRPMAP